MGDFVNRVVKEIWGEHKATAYYVLTINGVPAIGCPSLGVARARAYDAHSVRPGLDIGIIKVYKLT